MDHAKGDRRINEGKEVVVRKNGNNSGTGVTAVTAVTSGVTVTVVQLIL